MNIRMALAVCAALGAVSVASSSTVAFAQKKECSDCKRKGKKCSCKDVEHCDCDHGKAEGEKAEAKK